MNKRIIADKIKRISIFTVIFTLMLINIAAVFTEAAPKLSHYYNDEAGIMSSDTKSDIDSINKKIEGNTGAQIFVYVIESYKDKGYGNIEEYASETFKELELGNEDEDNGVLMVISMKEKEVRIEVGYGLESQITDGKAGNIIREDIAPNFEKDKYDEGIVTAFNSLVNEIEMAEEKDAEESQPVEETEIDEGNFLDSESKKALIPDKGDNYYSDKEGILSEDTKSVINKYGKEIEEKTGSSAVAVTTDNIDSFSSIHDYLFYLSKKWNIDENGMFLIYEKDNNKFHIIANYGLDSNAARDEANKIRAKYMQEYIEEDNYDEAIKEGYMRMAAYINDQYEAGADIPFKYKMPFIFGSITSVILIIFILFMIIVFPIIMVVKFKLSGSDSDYSGGSSGGSSGGGSSGGGGASGGW